MMKGSNNRDNQLNLVVALPSEARAFIDFYQLHKLTEHTVFDLYCNHQQNIHLIVSGVGKVNSSAATTYLYFASGRYNHAIYLNVGIAGSADFKLGDCVLIDKITDDATKKSCYPFVLKTSMPRASLITYDNECLDYTKPCLMDMEASAFFQTASKFVNHEQVQVIKVISDQDVEAVHKITKADVVRYINAQMAQINLAVAVLFELSQNELQHTASSTLLKPLLNKWHFTSYQQNTLKELLRRWQVHCKDIDPISYCENCQNSKQVINTLNQHLENKAYTWTPST